MLNRNLFLVLLVVAAVALVAPGLRGDIGEGVNEQPAKVLSAPQKSGNRASLDWYAGGTTLKRSSDGHFYADGLVEGASVQFMVDTGASVVALTGADAEAAGLTWDESQVRPIGRGASGTVYGVAARLASVEVGGIVLRDVDAVIIPQGLQVSLLGQSYLAKLSQVAIEGDSMVLGGARQ